MNTLQGIRVTDLNISLTEYKPGEYSLRPAGHDYADAPRQLYFRDPAGNIGRVERHTITEHEDGTISVSPSILVERGAAGNNWHGHLQRGVWSW